MFHSMTKINQVGQFLDSVQKKQKNSSLFDNNKVDVFFQEYRGPKIYDQALKNEVLERKKHHYRSLNISPNKSMIQSLNISYSNSKDNFNEIGQNF